MPFLINIFWEFCITVWAFVQFVNLMFGRNMSFQIMFLQIPHGSVGNCKVDYSNEQKKYDLSNNVFCKCPITVRAFVSFILLMWGRNVIFQIMFSANIASHWRHFSLLFWCGEDMWSLKLVFAVNIESQCRHLQGLLWILIQIRDNNCFL